MSANAPGKGLPACLLILPRSATRRIPCEATCPASLVTHRRGGTHALLDLPAGRTGPECCHAPELPQRSPSIRRLVRALLGRGAGRAASIRADGHQHADSHYLPLVFADRRRVAASD